MRPAIVRRRSLVVGGLGVAVSAVVGGALSGCTGAAPQLRIAAGEPGGTYVQFADLLGAALRDRGIATEVGVLITEGSTANLALLARGEADLALALINVAATAAEPPSALGRVYQNYFQCLVLADGPVRDVADLAGTTVSVGAPASGTVRTAGPVLDQLAVPGVRRVELSLRDAVSALSAGTTAALMWSGGIPVPEGARIGHQNLRLLDLTAALPGLSGTARGLYRRTVVPAGIYANSTPTPAIGIPNLLLARPGLDDAVVNGVVEVLTVDAARLVTDSSVGIQYLTSSDLIDTAPVPLSPVAEAAYAKAYG